MKRFAVCLAVLVSTSVLTACGGDGEKIAYRPVAYGENNQCYYVNDPAEAQLLMDQGLCERSWVPTVMPMTWHHMYYPYYSSPAYYRVYVPVATRTVYVEREKSWGSSNKKAIEGEAKKATYQGSNGKVVSASKIGATKYGAGNRFGPTGAKFGGGDRKATPTSSRKVTPETKVTTKATTSVTAKATPAPKAEAPKPKPRAEAPKPKTPTPKPKSSPPPKSSGGSKSFGGGSRGSGGRR